MLRERVVFSSKFSKYTQLQAAIAVTNAAPIVGQQR